MAVTLFNRWGGVALRGAAAELETLAIGVTDDGFTHLDPAGKKMGVATNWKMPDAYRDLGEGTGAVEMGKFARGVAFGCCAAE